MVRGDVNIIMMTGDVTTGEIMMIVSPGIHQDTMISMGDIKNFLHPKCRVFMVTFYVLLNLICTFHVCIFFKCPPSIIFKIGNDVNSSDYRLTDEYLKCSRSELGVDSSA